MKLATVAVLALVSTPLLSQQKWSRVAETGVTSLEGSVGSQRLSIQLYTRVVDIPLEDKQSAVNHATNCTYSVSRCSDLYEVRVFVGGKEVFVPRSVFADIADLTNARILNGGGDVATLVLRGGVGDEVFEVHIRLDKKRILERDVYTMAGVKSGPLEVTRYYLVPFK